MTLTKANILIAEDDPAVLESLETVFSTLGYAVRTVTDGLQAVAALREAVPDILLSDLNMPRMSGYELLSIVNRRFPTVKAVAMSGGFPGEAIPSGLDADAFFEKGGGIPSLLRALESAQAAERSEHCPPRIIWMQKINYEEFSEDFILMACPECFRSFPQGVKGTPSMILDTKCPHCGGSIVFAVVPTLETLFAVPYQPLSRLRPS
jgi:CheY-like chemotaxis protein